MQVDANEDRPPSSLSSDEISQEPPPREEEFEKFKKGRGQKIHEAFLSNKGGLVMSSDESRKSFFFSLMIEQYHQKKKECVELATEINKLKKEIDMVCV